MTRAQATANLAPIAIALGGALALVACSEATYLYLGRRYLPARNCLETTTSIDVLAGSDPGNCEAKCVSAPHLGDGGPPSRDTFVTTMCPPMPHGIENVSNGDTACVQALGALARKDMCLRDGGSTAPDPSSALDATAD